MFLGNKPVFVVVCVAVALAIAETFHESGRGVSYVERHRQASGPVYIV